MKETKEKFKFRHKQEKKKERYTLERRKKVELGKSQFLTIFFGTLKKEKLFLERQQS